MIEDQTETARWETDKIPGIKETVMSMREVFRGRFAGQDWWVSRTNEVACLLPDEKDCRYYHRLGGEDAVRFMAAMGTWIVPVEMVERLPDPDRAEPGVLRKDEALDRLTRRVRALEVEVVPRLAETVATMRRKLDQADEAK